MDNATRRRLAFGFLSNWTSRLAGTVVQLVQVPLFLHAWSVPLYGEWLILTSIPAYLSFSNIGFGSVAANEMTMLVARDDRAAALRVFQSCWWLIACMGAVAMALLSAGLVALPVRHWLRFALLSETDVRWSLLALGAAVFFGQLEQLLSAAYTCVGRYAYGTLLKSMITLGAFAAMTVPVMLGHGVRATAVTFAAANIAGTLLLGWMVRRNIGWIEFGWKHARLGELRRLAPPAIAFMGLPLGNALNLQGTLLAVGYALGPADVVVFGTARTVSRVALQMVQLVNSTFWPELGAAFGAGNVALVRTLHRRACQMALVIGLGLVAAMMTFGPWFLEHWTSHKVPPNRGLLFLLMLGVVLYAGWSTSSTLLASINRHQTLATYYLFATAFTVVVTYLAAKHAGLLAAAASLMLSEVIMNFYVVPASLRLSEDTWAGFLRSMFTYPRSLHPAAVMSRLRRAQPQPGEPAELDM